MKCNHQNCSHNNGRHWLPDTSALYPGSNVGCLGRSLVSRALSCIVGGLEGQTRSFVPLRRKEREEDKFLVFGTIPLPSLSESPDIYDNGRAG